MIVCFSECSADSVNNFSIIFPGNCSGSVMLFYLYWITCLLILIDMPSQIIRTHSCKLTPFVPHFHEILKHLTLKGGGGGGGGGGGSKVRKVGNIISR